MKQKDKNQRMLDLNTTQPGPTTINTAVGTGANNIIIGSLPPIKIQGRLNWLLRWNRSANRFVQVDCERLVHLIARKTPIKIAILLACTSVSGQITKGDWLSAMGHDASVSGQPNEGSNDTEWHGHDPQSGNRDREHIKTAHLVYDAYQEGYRAGLQYAHSEMLKSYASDGFVTLGGELMISGGLPKFRIESDLTTNDWKDMGDVNGTNILQGSVVTSNYFVNVINKGKTNRVVLEEVKLTDAPLAKRIVPKPLAGMIFWIGDGRNWRRPWRG